MKAYKVVKNIYGDILTSAWVYSLEGIGVYYEVGEKTKPTVKGSCLMAFDSLRNAETWMSKCDENYLRIYECEVVISRAKNWKFLFSSKSNISRSLHESLKRKDKRFFTYSPPTGSIKCSSITLTKRIK